MKFRTLVATSASGLALAFGILGGGLATATADPFPGHNPNMCSGQYDGSMCSNPDGLQHFQHLDFRNPQSGPGLDLDYRAN